MDRLRIFKIRRGMTTLEYAVVILAVAVALLAMQNYLKRAVSSKWREAADSFGNGRQYESQGAKATQITPY